MLKRRTGVDLRDILAAVGFVSLLYGLASWWVPAAWIAGGLLLLALALWPEIRRRTP